jgi:hypothetical protein
MILTAIGDSDELDYSNKELLTPQNYNLNILTD